VATDPLLDRDYYDPFGPAPDRGRPGFPKSPRGNQDNLNRERVRGEEARIADIKARRAAAYRATLLVAQHQDEPKRGRVPGQKFQKPKERPGRYRTVKEIARYLREKYGNFEKITPPRKNTITRDTGVARSGSRGTLRGLERFGFTLRYGRDITMGTGGFQPLIDEYAQQLGNRLADAQLRGQRNARILAIGRRGAAATRVQPSAAGLTNRTGAASTRSTTQATKTLAGPSGLATQRATAVGVSKTYPVARASTSTTSASATRNQVVTRNALTSLQRQANSQLDAQLDRYLKGTKTQVRTLTKTPTRTDIRSMIRPFLPTEPKLAMGSNTGLTSLNGQRVASLAGTQTASAKCDCPKPKKEKEKKSFSCSNPVVSRYIKDGLIIIKRKLVCPQSKLKSPSLPTAPTTTSSPAPRSSTRAAGNSSRSASRPPLRAPWLPSSPAPT